MCLYAIFIFVCSAATSQNLVLNPGFEDIDKSPSFVRDSKYNIFTNIIDYVEHWTHVYDKSSPDLLSPYCSNEDKKAPTNIFGYQPAKGGVNYMGIACNNNLCEYIQGQLSSPLIKDKIYNIGFYMSCADRHSTQYVESIGAHLSTQKITKQGQGLLALNPQIISNGQDLSNDKDWILITCTYKANGGERYIIIGTFSDDRIVFYDKKTKQASDSRNGRAYYYIDNIFAEEQNNETITGIPSGEFDALANINFELGKSDLDDIALSKLQTVLRYLQSHDDIKLKVIGHTDNTGAEQLNRKLSEERAQSAVQFLIDNGIDNSRLSAMGLGSDKPIVDNQSHQSKRENRRVEFVIFK